MEGLNSNPNPYPNVSSGLFCLNSILSLVFSLVFVKDSFMLISGSSLEWESELSILIVFFKESELISISLFSSIPFLFDDSLEI